MFEHDDRSGLPTPAKNDNADELLQAKKKSERITDESEIYWMIMFGEKYDELAYEYDLLERQIEYLKYDEEGNLPEIEFLTEKLEEIRKEMNELISDNGMEDE